MKKYNFFSTVRTVLTLFCFVIFVTSCSNSTSGNEDEEPEVEGIRLKMNGAVVAEQLPGQNITGEFELEPGEETDLITVYFLDPDGDEFQPHEDEHSLGYTFDDEGIAEFEQHAEDGKWSFHLHAESEGITNMQISLMHGDHSDFTSEKIHVHVEADE